MNSREVGMQLTIGDLFRALRKRWLLILVVALLCAGLGVAVGYLRGRSSGTQTDASQVEDAQAQYEQNLELSSTYDKVSQEAALKMRQEWMRLGKMYREHPLMNEKADEMSWEYLTLRFDPQSGNHYSTIYGWIQSADSDALFGGNEILAKYKNDLIRSDDREGESGVTIVGTADYDVKQAAEVLKEHFESCAAKSGIEILGISCEHGEGYMQYIADFQLSLSNYLTNTMAAIANANNAATVVPAPIPPSTDTGSGLSMKTVLVYGIAGCVLGILIGVCVVLFFMIRRGSLVSRRQLEDTFDLELLGDDSAASPDVLNANLDVMIGDKNRVMLLGSADGVSVAELASAWNKKSEREFVAGRDLLEDPETIDALQSVSGIVLGIRIGESRVADIGRILVRAAKLDKKVLGYIEV